MDKEPGKTVSMKKMLKVKRTAIRKGIGARKCTEEEEMEEKGMEVVKIDLLVINSFSPLTTKDSTLESLLT